MESPSSLSKQSLLELFRRVLTSFFSRSREMALKGRLPIRAGLVQNVSPIQTGNIASEKATKACG
jgi:hypothetical protein